MQLKLDELTATAAKLSDRARFLTKTAEPRRAEHTTIREELFHIRHTTDKYTDSDKASPTCAWTQIVYKIKKLTRTSRGSAVLMGWQGEAIHPDTGTGLCDVDGQQRLSTFPETLN